MEAVYPWKATRINESNKPEAFIPGSKRPWNMWARNWNVCNDHDISFSGSSITISFLHVFQFTIQIGSTERSALIVFLFFKTSYMFLCKKYDDKMLYFSIIMSFILIFCFLSLFHFYNNLFASFCFIKWETLVFSWC